MGRKDRYAEMLFPTIVVGRDEPTKKLTRKQKAKQEKRKKEGKKEKKVDMPTGRHEAIFTMKFNHPGGILPIV